jgi:uncharacterized protein DUF4288
MAWFAAHAILYFKLKSGEQDRFSVWENVYLIEAEDVDGAWEKAEARARQEEGDDDGTLSVDGQPATCVYAGIRKMSEVAHVDEEGRLGSGDEITYSEFEVSDEESVRALVGGEEVSVTFSELEIDTA